MEVLTARKSLSLTEGKATAIGWLLLGVVVLILCMRLFHSAYTSGDDGYTAFAALNPRGIWAAATEMAQFQGRFYQLFVYPLAMLPFLSGDIDTINCWRIVTFLFMFGGVAVLLSTIFGRLIGVLGSAIFLGLFDTVGGSYNPFHGLPMWFGLGCGSLALSLAAHIYGSRTRSISYLLVSMILYAVALMTYEVVILYVPLYLIISWASLDHLQPVIGYERIKRSVLGCMPIIVVSALYLIAYAAYRHYYPGTYEGAGELGISAPGRTIKPIIEFSIHGLYWAFDYSGRKGLTIQSLLATGSLGMAMLVACVAIPRFMAEKVGVEPEFASSKKLVETVLFISTGAYVFMPNILFGLTERYRVWSGDGVQFYLGSAQSAVAVVVLLCMVVRVILAMRNHFGRIMLLLSFPVVLALSYANTRNSQNFFSQSELMRNRWAVADWASRQIDAGARAGALPANQIIVCGSGFTATRELPVYFRNPDMLADVDLYWSRYFSWKTKRAVTYKSESAWKEKSDVCNVDLRLSYGNASAELEVADMTQQVHFSSDLALDW